jgi:meso-butanediol dehydrogenase/(S,S)-butanediol dehydrogenase/diacetyl reductase
MDGYGPRLHGKVAMISGIGSGQGRAAAVLFAQHGAKVVGCDVDPGRGQAAADEANAQPRARESGGEVVALQADTFDEDDVERWVREAVGRFGTVDVLYNNAAVGGFGMVHEMTLTEWQRAIQTELDGIFLACKHAIPHLRRTEPGASSILNTASVSGLISTLLPRMPGGMAHAAAKAAVIGVTRSLAHEYAPDGIRVNSISPGSIDTPSLSLTGYDTPDFRAAIFEQLCIPRRGRPEEVALLALYLASDESAYVTGANFVIDGGWTCS